MGEIKEIKCPVHGCTLGKYDADYGIHNVTFYCRKCRKEYNVTIPPVEHKKKNNVEKSKQI